MKKNEIAPEQTDRSTGHTPRTPLDTAFERIDQYIKKGMKLLDLCSCVKTPVMHAAKKGALVRCIDRDEKSRQDFAAELDALGLEHLCGPVHDRLEDLHRVQAEMFDAVILCFALPLMSQGEFQYVLRHAKRVLKRNGLLIIVDIAVPSHFIARIICFFRCLVCVPIGLVFGRCAGMPLLELHQRILNAGFTLKSEIAASGGALVGLIAMK